MLPLAGGKIKSADSADWKIDIDLQTRCQQQACEQCETASSRLDAAIPVVRRSDGEQYFAELRLVGAIEVNRPYVLPSIKKLALFLHRRDWQRDDPQPARRKVVGLLLRRALPGR